MNFSGWMGLAIWSWMTWKTRMMIFCPLRKPWETLRAGWARRRSQEQQICPLAKILLKLDYKYLLHSLQTLLTRNSQNSMRVTWNCHVGPGIVLFRFMCWNKKCSSLNNPGLVVFSWLPLLSSWLQCPSLSTTIFKDLLSLSFVKKKKQF